MEIKDRIKALADKKGISLPALEQTLGFGNSTIVKWGKSTPNADKLRKVADYFEVSMDYLMGREELSEADKRDIAKSLDQMMNQIESKEDEPLMYNGQPLSDASIQLLRNAFEFALTETKKENKVKYNPNKNK